MRGFGESTTEEVEYRPHADVVAVLDHFGVGQAAIGGNSMGGAFALDAVLETPDRFVAYVWVGAGIGGFDKRRLPAEEELFQAEGNAEDAGDWDLAAELDTRIWVDGWVDGVNQPDDARRPGGPRGDQGLGSRAARAGPGLRLVQAARPPAIKRLEEIAVPTLVVDRRAGHVRDARGRGGGRRERVRGARIERLPNVAHIIGMEAPETARGADRGAPRAAAALELTAVPPRRRHRNPGGPAAPIGVRSRATREHRGERAWGRGAAPDRRAERAARAGARLGARLAADVEPDRAAPRRLPRRRSSSSSSTATRVAAPPGRVAPGFSVAYSRHATADSVIGDRVVEALRQLGPGGGLVRHRRLRRSRGP